MDLIPIEEQNTFVKIALKERVCCNGRLENGKGF